MVGEIHRGNEKFLLPPGQGISPSGNFSTLRVREFILPPGQGISDSGNFSFREFILPSMNFSFREFILPL